ncbi:MAG: hypothetical protein JSU81_00910 [Candidatus Coatesbacteria bacterium]|nr:MAG: hypothetical protein JSU81_00910 [Candidatus Coatesbacteria bacterium]
MRLLVLGLVLAFAAGTAFGYGSYVAKVPNGDAFSCNTCHKEKKFYDDFKTNGNKWDETLAAKDSDGDGASNGVELQDPQGKWRENKPNPKIPGWDTYNPDDRTSIPPYVGVAPDSWGRVKALYR